MDTLKNLIIGGLFFAGASLAGPKAKAFQKEGRHRGELLYSFIMSGCILAAAYYLVEALKSAKPDWFLN
jgi:hypothetical protein